MAIQEDEETTRIVSHSQTLKQWEQIYSPLSLHSSSPSSIPSSLVDKSQQQINNHYKEDDFHIFPPSKHENLHISSFEQQQQQIQLRDYQVVDNDDEQEQKGPSSQSQQQSNSSPPQIFYSELTKEVLMKRLDLGFCVLWSKFIRIGSWVRGRRTFGSFFKTATGGFAAGFLVALLYMSWLRRRRGRAQLENKDRLIFLVEQADKKLSQLLDQIVLMNQFLSSRNKVPVSRSV
ncbi:hypothetical protein C5167_035482 [Papaver somniferum]|uniref:Transmembrane protein n=1 Tax=Papaver somniferum TaxID=3469 RepID=A0A4Y7KJY9_PAPSO|nr:uncharacterized protein LOC113300286 [Papaver somniferum]RZC72259.1 hypothetical protein C5167_035482 [Papaver somniferum]